MELIVTGQCREFVSPGEMGDPFFYLFPVFIPLDLLPHDSAIP